MADRKNVNKYMPPDFDPQKHGSINKYRGQHPLRERARKLDQGILIIRFELPYKIWCLGCNQTFAQGVRYNAEKKTIGKYYSTPIFSFRMKCRNCQHWLVIHTDPKNAEYVCIEGCRKKIEYEDTLAAKAIALEEEEVSDLIAKDPMYKLEHVSNDETRAKKYMGTLEYLKDTKDKIKDHAGVNRIMRDKFRSQKYDSIRNNNMQASLQKDKNLNIHILPETQQDCTSAKLVMLKRKLNSSGYGKSHREKCKDVLRKPIIQPRSSKRLASRDYSKKKLADTILSSNNKANKSKSSSRSRSSVDVSTLIRRKA